MPNWTNENGISSFNKLECKRCLSTFEIDKSGEIPIHKCLGGFYKSITFINKFGDVEHNVPIKVKK